MSEEKKSEGNGFLITINPAVAYRWIRSTNSYKISELESKTAYRIMKKYELDKHDAWDMMKYVIVVFALIIAAYIAYSMFSHPRGVEQVATAANHVVNATKVIKT